MDYIDFNGGKLIKPTTIDYTTLKEQLNSLTNIINNANSIDDVKIKLKSNNIIISEESLDSMMNDCINKRIAIEQSEIETTSLFGLIYTKSISKSLAVKLESAGIKNLRNLKNMTFDELRSIKVESKTRNLKASKSRLFGTASMLELCKLMIKYDIDFKDKSSNDLKIMIEHYNEFAN